MAFIKQESSFQQGAKPERERIFLVLFLGKEKVVLMGMLKLLTEHGICTNKRLGELFLEN